MLLNRTHSIAYRHVCNIPAIDISHLIHLSSEPVAYIFLYRTMQWLDFFHALKIHTPIMLYFVTITLLKYL